MPNLIGNLPNQVPTNADLGGMAYQDADYAIVGNITVEANLISSSANITSANITTANVSGLTTFSGNVLMQSNTTVTGNLFLTNVSYDGNSVINKSYVDITSIIFGF